MAGCCGVGGLVSRIYGGLVPPRPADLGHTVAWAGSPQQLPANTGETGAVYPPPLTRAI